MKPETTDSQWPRWPQGTAGNGIVNLVLASNVDSLLQLIFGPRSAFTLKCQEVHGNKDYLETGWEPSIEEAKAALANGRNKPNQLKPQAIQDRFRMTSCSGTSMGLKFKTEELQRVTVCQPGKQYEVEACVATTATYGDRFRCICRYKLAAQEKGLSKLTITFTIIFVKPVNFVIKKAIENGANSGISKSFEDTVQVLGTFVDVEGGRKPSPAVAVPETPQPPVGNPMGGWGPVFGHIQDSMASLVEPSLVWTLRGLGRPQNPSPATLRAAGVMGIALLYLLLSLLLACLARLEQHCRTSPGFASHICAWSLHAAGLPQSARQLGMGCLFLVLIHTVLLRTASEVRLLAQRYQALRAARAAGVGEPETPQRGIRFEGYAEALETANAAMSDAQGEAPAAAVAADISDAFRLKDWTKLLSPDTWFPAKQPSSQKTQLKGHDPSAQPSKAPSLTLPRDLDAAGPSGLHAEAAAAAQEANHRGNPGKVAYSNLLSPTFLGRTKDMMSSLGLGPAVKPEEASPRAPATADAKPLAQAPSAQKIAVLRPEITTLADKPAAPIPAEEIPTVPPGPLEMDVLSTGPMVEEVFENERLSAFLIWGHSWPGHFLPTDRVGHWSKRDGAPGGKESMSFANVAPSLPEGWQWEDEDWRVDLAGASESAVDADGWSYAVDFPWLRLPPTQGSGRQRKMQHFVRRRRWLRVRRPISSRSAGLEGELSKLGAEAEAMAATTPTATSANASLPLPLPELPPLQTVLSQNTNSTRHPQPVELPDPPSPTMLSEAAARSRSKATPAAVGPVGYNKLGATSPVLSKPHKSAVWPWRRSLSRPPSADGSKPTPSAASMTAAMPIPLHPSHREHGQPAAAVAAHAPDSAASSSRSVEDQLTDALQSTAAAQPDTEDPRRMSPDGTAGVGLNEGTAASETEPLASAASGAAETEPLNAETGLTLSQHQQLLDEGHFGGWSSASGVIKREKAQRARSIDPAAPLPRLGSRQNSRDLGITGSSPERRSFFGIRHTHASPIGSSPPAGVSRQGSGQSLPSHSPMKPSNASMSPPTRPSARPPSHPLEESYVRDDDGIPFSSEQSFGGALSKELSSADVPIALDGPATSVSGGTTPAAHEHPAQPAGPSPFGMPAMQGAGQQASFMPFDTYQEAASGFTGGVYGIANPPESKARTSGLARGTEGSTDMLASSEDGLEQLQTSMRTHSSSSSGDGTHRPRSSFTQSVAKLGREALENLQDLQTAAQRALTGPKPKEEQSSPNSFSPLESGVRAATDDMQQLHPGSSPSHDSDDGLLHGGSVPVGHLSQAISEHLACATGGSGRPTTPADVSPQDFISLEGRADARSGHPAAAHGPPPDDHALTQPNISHSARRAVEVASQQIEESSCATHLAEDGSTLEQALHRRPPMETPSGKRHKVGEAASEADTSSSELNPADFGLSTIPVWQRSPSE
ncbi:hypothetical protein WJX74_010063 [Apatococcus lobatus]|uniref:VASt domain-containing protein n=1 Tax=Apatococcus lobatus TaxID=904363 RepID=A0AAW1SB45_9CHLO